MAQVSSLESLQNAINESKAKHVWLDPERGLAFGNYPKIGFRYDFGDERLRPLECDAPIVDKKEVVNLILQAPRITTPYEIETKEKIYRVGSAKEALRIGLDIIEEIAPGTMAQLSEEKGRTRRPVAKIREDLFDKKTLIKHSERLKCGFWYGTNNKAQECINTLARAAQLAELGAQEFSVRKSDWTDKR